jgi:hypothetical protein
VIRVIVGDLHGQPSTLKGILHRFLYADEVLVAGDFGLGFDAKLDRQFEELGQYIEEHGVPAVSFIRGNHDNPKACKAWSVPNVQYIPDGYQEYETLFLGGAKSHDTQHRREGIDWWPDEELSEIEWASILGNLKGQEQTIKRIVSHDAPKPVKDYLKQMHLKNYEDTLTSDKMQELMGMLPNLKLWVHGHYHTYHQTTIGGVKFIGLAPAHDAPLTSVQVNYGFHTYFDDTAEFDKLDEWTTRPQE